MATARFNIAVDTSTKQVPQAISDLFYGKFDSLNFISTIASRSAFSGTGKGDGRLPAGRGFTIAQKYNYVYRFGLNNGGALYMAFDKRFNPLSPSTLQGLSVLDGRGALLASLTDFSLKTSDLARITKASDLTDLLEKTLQKPGSSNTISFHVGTRTVGNIFVGTDITDTIQGSAFNDVFNGGKGNDKLIGNDGKDILRGGLGKDELTGGLKLDTFRFAAGDFEFGSSKADRIIDFQDSRTREARDQIEIDPAVLRDSFGVNLANYIQTVNGFSTPTNLFYSGNSKTQASTTLEKRPELVVYDKATGSLFLNINATAAGWGQPDKSGVFAVLEKVGGTAPILSDLSAITSGPSAFFGSLTIS